MKKIFAWKSNPLIIMDINAHTKISSFYLKVAFKLHLLLKFYFGQKPSLRTGYILSITRTHASSFIALACLHLYCTFFFLLLGYVMKMCISSFFVGNDQINWMINLYLYMKGVILNEKYMIIINDASHYV